MLHLQDGTANSDLQKFKTAICEIPQNEKENLKMVHNSNVQLFERARSFVSINETISKATLNLTRVLNHGYTVDAHDNQEIKIRNKWYIIWKA